MARAGDLAEMLRRALENYSEGWNGVSDQTLLHRLYVDAQGAGRCGDDHAPPAVRIQLDHHQTAFANTGGPARRRRSRKQLLISHTTQAAPSFVTSTSCTAVNHTAASKLTTCHHSNPAYLRHPQPADGHVPSHSTLSRTKKISNRV
jgi:hypothetical protein